MEIALHVVHALIEALLFYGDFLLLIQRVSLAHLLFIMTYGRLYAC